MLAAGDLSEGGVGLYASGKVERQRRIRVAGVEMVESVKRFTQRLEQPNTLTYFGKGKLEEVGQYIRSHEEISVAIFDDDLSPKQLHAIEEVFKVKVLDRSGLILDIFAQRAASHEGKLQVELAQLEHLSTRLEGLTKEYGVGILVSENIVKAVPAVIYRELDRVRVKGKLEPISIYEPIGQKGEVADQLLDEIDRFHRALDRFRQQRWEDAEALLNTLIQADPKRKVYGLYMDRVAALREAPPGANWDGVFTFTHK